MVRDKSKFLIIFIIFIFSICCDDKLVKNGVDILDNADMFTTVEEQILKNILIDYEKESKNEIVVLTVVSLKGEDINEYAIKMHNKLKVGKLKYLNGILIVISKEDRKIRISIAKGLIDSLTNERSKNIIENYTIPLFKKGKYFDGLVETINQIKRYAKNDWK